MGKSKEFKSVSEYMDAQPENIRAVLEKLRTCILTATPNAIEIINYNLPSYVLVIGGKRDQQIMMAGYRNHVGLYPNPVVIEKFDDELKPYKKGKGSVQFSVDQPLPEDLIIQMVKYRKELLKHEIN